MTLPCLRAPGIQGMLLGLFLGLGPFTLPVSGQKFYRDDPLVVEPPPLEVQGASMRRLNQYVDFFASMLGELGERHPEGGFIPAQSVNSLGEVMDGPWYVNRHGRKRMTMEELTRGPGNAYPPSSDGVWTVVATKTEGVTPGFTIKDRTGRRYVVKFDPMANIELASAADVITSKFLYALGYHVPQNYIVYFDRDRIAVSPDTEFVDSYGRKRRMTSRDVDELLIRVPADPARGYRAVASLQLQGEPLGPFLYYGTRKDDPNDIVSHEHRRELRGLSVIAAWLGHNEITALNSLDTLVQENETRFFRHHLIDFGASLGSDTVRTKSPRAGNEYLFSWAPMLKSFFSLGLWVPRWARADYPNFPSVGNFECEIFEPKSWKPSYPIPAFENCLPDDAFWAARLVMRFTDQEILRLVKTGEYSDSKAEDWLVRCLIQRRDKIGRAYFSEVLPLDHFEIREGRLEFQDLAVEYGFRSDRSLSVAWSLFDNMAEQHTMIQGATVFDLPDAVRRSPEGTYSAAWIVGEDRAKAVTVYLRREDRGVKVVGIDRSW